MLDDGGQMVTGAAGGELAPGLDDGGQVVTGADGGELAAGLDRGGPCTILRARLAPVLDDGGQVVTGAAAGELAAGPMTAARWSPAPRRASWRPGPIARRGPGRAR